MTYILATHKMRTEFASSNTVQEQIKVLKDVSEQLQNRVQRSKKKVNNKQTFLYLL